MAEIYYCKNEDDMKRVAIHLLKDGINYYSFETGLDNSRIYSCDFVSDEIECCEECELEKCLLVEHIEDKDIRKHIQLCENDSNYPCIVCVADTYATDERITICSIADAKDNTKYGYE